MILLWEAVSFTLLLIEARRDRLCLERRRCPVGWGEIGIHLAKVMPARLISGLCPQDSSEDESRATAKHEQQKRIAVRCGQRV